MSYTPVIPLSGYAGWSFLNRTMEKQQAAFAASADIQRDETYFREKIGDVRSAEELVSDRRLLRVALGAYGLDDDIDNKYFIRKVLEEGSLDSESLANKMSDKRYLEFTIAFGFGDYDTPRTVMSDFADKLLARYEERQFEIAVGEVDDTLRLAMNAEREIPLLAAKTTSEKTKWYSIIGSDPLAAVFQTGLGLPASVGSLDVDQQVAIYQKKTEAMFGSSDPALFSDKDAVDKLVKNYLLLSQLSAGSSQSSGSVALQLLQASGGGNTLSLLL
ncbi:MAG: DUF1217 domain-containing protein [Paracoccaceae bacterium]|jgi:hypothetical protein